MYWIQPNLTHMIVSQDKYLYIKNDEAENSFFMLKGAAGFVHLNSPNNNIIFADFGEGVNFG